MSYEEDLKRGLKDHGGSASFRYLDAAECEFCGAMSSLKTDGTHVVCGECLDEIDNLPDEEEG